MSVRVMNHVWQHSAHKGADLLVLLAIADNADDESKTAFPSIAYLSHKTRMTGRGVQKIIRKLEASGELTVIPPGEKKSNTYRVNTESMHHNPRTEFTPEQNSPLNHRSGVPLNGGSPKPSIEPSTNKQRARSLPDDFSVTDEMRQRAKDRYGLTDKEIDDKTDRFKSWALAKDQKYVRWDQAWINFMEPKTYDAPTTIGLRDKLRSTMRVNTADHAGEDRNRLLAGLPVAWGSANGGIDHL